MIELCLEMPVERKKMRIFQVKLFAIVLRNTVNQVRDVVVLE